MFDKDPEGKEWKQCGTALLVIIVLAILGLLWQGSIAHPELRSALVLVLRVLTIIAVLGLIILLPIAFIKYRKRKREQHEGKIF